MRFLSKESGGLEQKMDGYNGFSSVSDNTLQQGFKRSADCLTKPVSEVDSV